MNAIVQFNKRKYETPLEMLERMRIEQSALKDEKLSYLGRLDPLAHGAMLVAVGEANKEREKYLGLSKTYKVEFLFGISTDTGDVLGLVQNVQSVSSVAEDFQKAILNLKGKHKLPYPMYSSKTVDGKPLHEYAREGKDVLAPERSMEVMSVSCAGTQVILGKEITRAGIEATEKVSGDFRQENIKKVWEDFFKNHGKEEFMMVTTTLAVTGGTYVRALTTLLTQKTDMPCLAYDIERLKIGG